MGGPAMVPFLAPRLLVLALGATASSDVFTAAAAAAAGAAAPPAAAAAASASAAAEGAPPAPRGRQLLIANATGVGTVTTFGTVTKAPQNPLLKIGAQLAEDKDPERPWSSGGIYSAIVADQSGRRQGKPWRAYFTASLNWTMDPRCPPGSTCETGAGGLLYAESADGIAWRWAPVGIMWPPGSNATRSEQARSDILRFAEEGTAVFEDTNPAVRAGKPDSEWAIKFVGQLNPLEAQSDKVMHSGGSGNYVTSSDGIHFDDDHLGTLGHVDVDGNRRPGARWDTENNFFFDQRTQRYVGVMRAPRDPRCKIWWPTCLQRCKSCGSGNLTDRQNGLVSVRAISIMQVRTKCVWSPPSDRMSHFPCSMRSDLLQNGCLTDNWCGCVTTPVQSANASFESRFTDEVVSVHPTPTEQLYSQVTFPMHGLYFGLVSKADVYEKPFPVGTFKGKPAFGHVNRVHCALQWSRDLQTWEAVEELADFIPLEWTRWDSHLCYASASPVEMEDGAMRVYYGASSGPHDGVNATTQLGLAVRPSLHCN
eukprot:SAG22_NODE_1449_length_4399_cov_6.411860_4_plen_537_part_00